MKRWIVLVSALALFGEALPSYAADLQFNGDFRVRGFYTDNLSDQSDDFDDHTAYNTLRFLLTATAASGPTTGVVTMDFTSAGNTGNLRFGEIDAPYGPKDDRFALLQAYLSTRLSKATLTAGRKVFIMGHGIILDDAVDGFILDVPLGGLTLSLADLKVVDNTPDFASGGAANGLGTVSGHDTDLYAANLALHPRTDWALNVFGAYYNDLGPNIASSVTPSGTTDLHVMIAGVSADGRIGAANLTAEVDFMRGSVRRSGAPEPDIQGMNAQIGVQTKLSNTGAGLMVLYASGQDPAEDPDLGGDLNMNGINGNIPVGIILTNGGARSLAPKDGTCLSVNGDSLGGVPNCIGGSGLMALKATGAIHPMERLGLEAGVIYARAAADNFDGGDSDIGIELDGTARYAIDPNTSVLAGVGYLMAGDFFKASPGAPAPDDMVVGVLELSFRF